MLVILFLGLAGFFAGGLYACRPKADPRYETLARAVCDPGSWQVRRAFGVGQPILRGRINGVPFEFAIFNSDSIMARTHLLVERSVSREAKLGSGGYSLSPDPAVATLSKTLLEHGMTDFYASPKNVPFYKRAPDTRPLGFSSNAGADVSKISAISGFDADLLKKDVKFLAGLAF